MKINKYSIYHEDQTESYHTMEDIKRNWSVSALSVKNQSTSDFYEILDVSSLSSVQGTVIVTSFSQNGNSLSGFESISKQFRLEDKLRSVKLLDNSPLTGVSLLISYSIVDKKLILSITIEKSVDALVQMSGTVSIDNIAYWGSVLPRLNLTADSNVFNEKVVVDELQIKDKISLKCKKTMYGTSDSYEALATGLYVVRPYNTYDRDNFTIVYLRAGDHYSQSGSDIWLLAELK